ncbi:MAG: right-handed parallel beta-helix repeat-containing protein [Methanotrichaceae archaeon]|nr:right-handed parallel beta-helix repeat-containing protein [Methanotrichaceae archaeon]
MLHMVFKYRTNFRGSRCIARRIPFQGILRVCLSAVLAFWLVSAAITSTTYIVSEKSNDYSVQSAINKAKEGDRIIVKSGTYSERLNITKKLIVKGVDTGEGLPVINANEKKSAINLLVDGTWLEGFLIVNSGSSLEDAGIKVFSNNNLIRGNILNNNSYGIYLKNSANNKIESNLARGNDVGIALQSSNNNMVINNFVTNNSFAGFFSGNSRNNTIRNNTGQENAWVGFLFNDTKNSSIQENAAIGNANAGIWMLNSRYNDINENNASNSPIFGFRLDASFNNTISGNTAHRNLDGISMDTSSGNIIIENNISNNIFGIYLDRSSKNLIFLNNFVENAMNSYSYNSSNQWNSDKAFNYLYKGMVSWDYLGNFWSDYEGNDAYESGIGNAAYINEYIKDEKPLISRKERYQILP